MKTFVIREDPFVAAVEESGGRWVGRIYRRDHAGWFVMWSVGPGENSAVCDETYKRLHALLDPDIHRRITPVSRPTIPKADA